MKTILKTTAIILMAITLCLCFSACSGNKLIGKWEITEKDYIMTFEFKKDEKFTASTKYGDEEEKAEGTYEINEDIITLTLDNSDKNALKCTFDIKEKVLTLTPDNDSTLNLYFAPNIGPNKLIGKWEITEEDYSMTFEFKNDNKFVSTGKFDEAEEKMEGTYEADKDTITITPDGKDELKCKFKIEEKALTLTPDNNSSLNLYFAANIGPNQLLGKWEMYQSGSLMMFEFKSDKKFTMIYEYGGEKEETKGTYKVSGNNATLTSNDSDDNEFKCTFKISGEKLILTDKADGMIYALNKE